MRLRNGCKIGQNKLFVQLKAHRIAEESECGMCDGNFENLKKTAYFIKSVFAILLATGKQF